MNNTQNLLDFCWHHRDRFIRDFSSLDIGVDQFNSLIALVQDGKVTSWDDLADYGMDY